MNCCLIKGAVKHTCCFKNYSLPDPFRITDLAVADFSNCSWETISDLD